VILGLSIDILGPRRIVLESRDRPNAVSVCAEAVDHGLPVLSDEAGAQLIPATHRPPVRDAGVVCGVKWAQTSRNKLLVDPLRDRGPAGRVTKTKTLFFAPRTRIGFKLSR
jgi:hypothetical protein